jgi:hypothetical protein
VNESGWSDRKGVVSDWVKESTEWCVSKEVAVVVVEGGGVGRLFG